MEKLFIKNHDACATIVWCQFLKASKMSFSQFKTFFNKLGGDQFKILFKQCEPFIKKYWSKRHFEYPLVKGPKIKTYEIWWSSRFGFICDTEYEAFMFMVHALFTIMTGIDKEQLFVDLDRKLKNHKQITTSLKMKKMAFNEYFWEMAKYTSKIPLFSMEYCITGEIEHDNHIVCVIYDTDKDILIDLNSNLEPRIIREYNPVIIRYLTRKFKNDKEPQSKALISSGFSKLGV